MLLFNAFHQDNFFSPLIIFFYRKYLDNAATLSHSFLSIFLKSRKKCIYTVVLFSKLAWVKGKNMFLFFQYIYIYKLNGNKGKSSLPVIVIQFVILLNWLKNHCSLNNINLIHHPILYPQKNFAKSKTETTITKTKYRYLVRFSVNK